MANAGILRRLGGLAQFREAWLAGVLFMILALILLPLPPMLLDVLIGVNIMTSVVILLISMYITRALDFSVFPAMLLLTTLLRVSISIAGVRMILRNTPQVYASSGGNVEQTLAAAGHVIKSFGETVAGGSLAIGLIMFIIITVVQFVIVAQGAGRVSEVAARFTLDAMPGKQMAIDAELNARIITPEEAKAKRADLEAESNFFGAMDGAMKFVKGDAIAGIIIILVSLIGGFIVGGLMNHMPFGVAAKTFSVLTVGEGLIEQLPALLISIAAGMVVTRSASPKNMGSELGAQLTQSPRALGIAAAIVFVLGIVPGLPKILILLSLMLGTGAFMLARKARRAAMAISADGSVEAPQEEINSSMLRTDAISLEVGDELANLADPEINGELLERLKHVRKRIAMEFGVIAPGVRVRPHPQLPTGAYQIRIKGDLIAEGEVMTSSLLGIGQNLDIPGLQGEPTTDPIYGTPAVWVPVHQQQLAEQAGLQMFDAQDVVSTHVAEIIKQHLAELLTREEVMELLNMARQDNPTVVAELMPQLLSLGQVRMVLQNLVTEQVPIKDLGTILNVLADQAYHSKDVFQLTEFVRQGLGRKICQRYQQPDGSLKAFVLSPAAEAAIQQAIQLDGTGGHTLMLDPATNERLHSNLAQALTDARGVVLDPIIICQPRIRRFVKKLFERTFSKLVVLSYAEIVAGVQVQNVQQIDA